jgi:AAA+ ATPase superfamily predicted ATPase
MKKINPFTTSGYVSPEFFCDREEETGRLLSAIRNKRNLTLISLRRMGKTGLLKHVQYCLENESKGNTVVYVDLMPTMSGQELLGALATALVRINQKEKNIFEKILSLLSTLRPVLTYDNFTGKPLLEIKTVNPSDISYGFEHLLKFFSSNKNNLIIMLDEFQQVSKYAETNIESILRSVIQEYPQISFLFSGSNKHMLEAMFATPNRPFYQSTGLIYLGPIDKMKYIDFIHSKFLSAGKSIEIDSIEKILEWTRFHTYYVQYVCNSIYSLPVKRINAGTVNEIFYQIVTDQEPLYVNYRNLLPSHQFRLIQAIAIEGTVSQPTSGKFIQNHDLTSASSVKTSLKALLDKEMIYKTDNDYLVYDVFFTRWLQYHFGKGSEMDIRK